MLPVLLRNTDKHSQNYNNRELYLYNFSSNYKFTSARPWTRKFRLQIFDDKFTLTLTLARDRAPIAY